MNHDRLITGIILAAFVTGWVLAEWMRYRERRAVARAAAKARAEARITAYCQQQRAIREEARAAEIAELEATFRQQWPYNQEQM